MQVMGIPKGLRLRAADFEKGSWDGKMTAEEITNGAGLLDADGRTLYELPEVPAPTGVKKKAGPRRSDASGEGDDVSEGGAVVGKRRNSRSAGDPQGDEGGREMSLKKVIEASDASKKKPRAEAANGAQEAALKKTAAKGSERRVSRELLAIVGNFDLVAQEGRRATRATAGDPAPAVDTGPRRDGKGKRKLDSPVEAPRGKKARTPGDARAQAGAEVPGQESGPQKLVSGGATELVALLSQLGNEGIGLGLDAHAVLAGAATDVSASAGTATLPAEGALQGGGEPGPTIVDLVHDEPSPEDATPTKRARRSAAASEGVPFLGQLGKRAAATKACQKIKQNLIRERIPINDDGELVPPEKAEPSHRAASKARPVLNWETRPQVPIAPRLPTMHPAGPRFLGSGRVAPAGGVHPGQMHPPAGAQTALPSTGRQPEFRLGDPVGEPFASQLLEFTFSVPRDSATDRPVVFVTSTRPYVGGHMKAGGAVILDQSGWQLHQMAYPAVVLDHSARTAVSLLPVPVPLPGSPMASVSGGPLPPQNGAVRKSAAPELQASASAAPAIRSPLVIPSPQTSHQEPVHAPRFLQNGAPSVSPMLVARPVAAPVPTPERTPTPGPSAGSPAPEEVGGSWGKRKSPGNVACLALGAPTGGKRQKVAEEELSPVAGIPEVRSEELGGAAEAGGHVAEGIGTPMPSDPVSVPPPPAVSTEPPESSASQLGFGPLGIEAVPSQGTEPQGRPKRKVTSQVTAPPAAPRRAVMRTRPMRGGSFPSEKIIVAPEAGRSALSGGVKAGTPGPQQTHQAGVEPPPAAGPPALPVKKRIGRPPKRKLDEAEAAAVADVTTGALGADVSKGPSSGADVSKGPSGDSDVDTQAALPAAHTPQKKRSQKGKRPREEAGAAGGAAANVSITPADVSMTEAAIVAAPPVPKATSRGKGKGLQQQQAGRSMSAVRGGPAQTAIVPRGAVSAVGQGGAASNGAANGRKLVAGRGGGPLELPKFLLDSSDEESDDEEDDEEEDHGPPEEVSGHTWRVRITLFERPG